MQIKNNKLYIGNLSAAALAKKYGTPLYVYDAAVIRDRALGLKNSVPARNLRWYYACKANTNFHILQLIKTFGFGIEAVSMGEVRMALAAGFPAHDIIFTCDNLSEKDLRALAKQKIFINTDSLSQLEKYGMVNPGAHVGIRVNQGIGGGAHAHIITGGPDSKFGIYPSEIPKALAIAKRYKLSIAGIHQHIGSGVRQPEIILKAIRILLKTAEQIPTLQRINFGGGFGIPYRPDESPLPLPALGKKIARVLDTFRAKNNRAIEFAFEPGKYLVGEAGTLLATVIDIKKRPEKKFVGVDSGFHHLIRPILYGAYHPIVNANHVDGRKEAVTIVGNICESGDVFAHNRLLPVVHEGDTLAILNAGAYGFSMSSNYNLHEKPAEILIEKNRARVIRKREIFRIKNSREFWL